MVEKTTTNADRGFDNNNRPQEYYVTPFDNGADNRLSPAEINRILTIFRAGYSDYVMPGMMPLLIEYTKEQLLNPTTRGVLVRKKTTGEETADAIAGFTYFHPVSEYDKEEIEDQTQEAKRFQGTPGEYDNMLKRTAIIELTVLHPEDRKRGGWRLMMDLVDKLLEQNSEFDYAARFLRKETGYADIVRDRYHKQDRIVYEEDIRTIMGKERKYLRTRVR